MGQQQSPQQPVDSAFDGGERPPTPGPLTDAFARHLKMSKDELLAVTGTGSTIVQTGGAYLDPSFPVDDLPGEQETVHEPIIETFVVDPGGACSGTGADLGLIEAWLPLVEGMVGLVLAAMADHGVALDGPGYLTTSLTPVDQVTQLPHIDDDQYLDGDGVGLVAIAASHDGPRIACAPIPHRPARSMLPLEFEDGVFERFAAGTIAKQRAAADRIVVFPQFGQLHSGPVIAPNTVDPIRRLLVFRVRTQPVAAT